MSDSTGQEGEVGGLLDAVVVAKRLLAYAGSSHNREHASFYTENALTLELSVRELLRHAHFSSGNRELVTAALRSLR